MTAHCPHYLLPYADVISWSFWKPLEGRDSGWSRLLPSWCTAQAWHPESRRWWVQNMQSHPKVFLTAQNLQPGRAEPYTQTVM